MRLLKKIPPPLAAHCTLILKRNKPGRLNCTTQSGVYGEGIVLTGCRWAPASHHEADHRRDIKWRWPHDNRRGVTGRCLNRKKKRGMQEGRKEGSKQAREEKHRSRLEQGFPHTAGVIKPCPRVFLDLSHPSSWIYIFVWQDRKPCTAAEVILYLAMKKKKTPKKHTWACQQVIFSGDGGMRTRFTDHGTLER